MTPEVLQQLSTDDLRALKAGDLTKVSNAGLTLLRGGWAKINASVQAAQPGRDQVRGTLLEQEGQPALAAAARAGGPAYPAGSMPAAPPGFSFAASPAEKDRVALLTDELARTTNPRDRAEIENELRMARGQAPLPAAPSAAPAAPAAPAEPVPAPAGEFDTTGEAVPATGDRMSRATVYGLSGGLAGALAGAVVPVPGATFAVSTLGSALGTYFGTYEDAKAAGSTDQEASDAAEKAAAIDVIISAGGGLAIKAGGKVVATLASTGPVAGLLKRIGFKPRLATDDVLTGKNVFEGTTQAELTQEAKAGAQQLVESSGVDLTGRQLTGSEGFTEAFARSGARTSFERGAALQDRTLHTALTGARDNLRSGARRAGEAFNEGLDLAEQRVKDKLGPVFEKLSATRGPGTEVVDIASAKSAAQRLLSEHEQQSIKTLSDAELSLLRNVASGKASISPAEAHNIQSAFFRKARDMDKSTELDSALQGKYTQFASMIRDSLDAAMEKAVKSGMLKPEDLAQIKQARELYREMASTLYDPALKRARGAAEERVAGVVGQVGDSERVDALRRLIDFGDKIDNLPSAPVARQVAGLSTELVVPAGVRNTTDLARLTRVAETQGLNEVELARHAKDLGLPPAPAGKSTRALFEETLNDARASFFAKHMGTPELMASLPQRAASEDFQRSLKALFPTREDRLAIERFSQVAQFIGRTSSDSSGLRAVAGTLGQFAGGIGGRLLATISAGALPKVLSAAYLNPALRRDLPVVAAYALRVAGGAAATTAEDVPEAVKRFLAAVE